MQRLTEETVLAVGRLTLAAAELEYVLARIAADQAGDDPATLFAAPGASLLAARGSVRFASADHHNEFSRLLDSAELYLTQSQRAVRAMWSERSRVDAVTIDEITGLLLRCRDRLQALVDEAVRMPIA
ncbi:hypothetical protein AB0M79_26540 [Polymorphospora sp. NPDC051019]|uniref:hypothetical protein n=1 Tax=Polymorphospora sp. NPDC051019 TaxID=3155725 RepID=UPI0034445C35